MIARDQIIEIIRKADERFVVEVEQFQDEWSDDPVLETEGWPHYILFSSISRIIAKDIRTGNTANFPTIFKMIEKLHIEGDDYTREAVTIGLLEDLQNIMLHDNTGLHLASPYLLPESKRWWDKLISFWDGNVDALQDD